MSFRNEMLNKGNVGVNRDERPVGTEDKPIIFLGEHNRPAEMISIRLFLQQPVHLGMITDDPARQIGIQVRILLQQCRRIHDPGITQVAEHEGDVPVLQKCLFHRERMRIFKQASVGVGQPAMDNYRQLILCSQLVHRIIYLVPDVIVIIARIQLDADNMVLLQRFFERLQLPRGMQCQRINPYTGEQIVRQCSV
ncbi:hypothetical protein D3C73_1037310 [compost metagenome]